MHCITSGMISSTGNRLLLDTFNAPLFSLRWAYVSVEYHTRAEMLLLKKTWFVTPAKHIFMFSVAGLSLKNQCKQEVSFSLASQEEFLWFPLDMFRGREMRDPKSNISARHFTDARKNRFSFVHALCTKWIQHLIIPQRATLPVQGRQRTAVSISKRVAGSNL